MNTKWIAHETDQGQDLALYCFAHAGSNGCIFCKVGEQNLKICYFASAVSNERETYQRKNAG